jgi:glycosyltransferase involved in cell wall biosynthesis
MTGLPLTKNAAAGLSPCMASLGAEPAVSIVVPTRNRAPLLERAICSVIAQSRHDWELIVVDDASEDGTRNLVSRFAAVDPRIRSILLAEKAGGAATRNHGIDAARADWVAFLDDDDEWLPAKLEEQLRTAEQMEASAGFVYCPCRYVDDTGREFVLQVREPSDGECWHPLLRGNFVSTPTVVVRRELLLRAGGFDVTLPRLHDWDLWLRLAKLTEFRFMPRPLVRAYHTPGAISTRPDALVTACAILDRKFVRSGIMSPEEAGTFHYALGHALMIGGASAEGRRFLWNAVRRKPGPPRRAAMALLAVLGSGAYRLATRSYESYVRWRRLSSAPAASA